MKQEPEGFALFWACWRPHMRHTDGRGDARDRYRKQLLSGADPQDILDGAKAFLRSLPEKDRPYIPLAATWLNKESYADWCEFERKYQAHLAAKSENVVQMRPAISKSKWLQEWEAQQEQKKQEA